MNVNDIQTWLLIWWSNDSEFTFVKHLQFLMAIHELGSGLLLDYDLS